jgi:magnesium chelatase subunit I
MRAKAGLNAVPSPQQQASPSVYPFTAIVGQDEMKLSLILNVVEPLIGGTLLMGHRGTGKSTAVRALAQLMPPIQRVKGCPYSCDPSNQPDLCQDCLVRLRKRRSLPAEQAWTPVVELPLGATEDRVCGTLDIERVLAGGQKAFEPGLLARANRGFLYIDEVNLLEDHLVDLLLDVAASGWNIVEREGISVRHPCRFVLAGSGNPEEGELRPQLLDRFGLHARISTITGIEERVEIVRLRERFERDPVTFSSEMEPQQERLRRRIEKARRALPSVNVESTVLSRVVAICMQLGVDGHRGELTAMRAARALAAFEGDATVNFDHVRRVAVMSLRHRLRKDPLGAIDAGVRIEQALDMELGESRARIHG